MRVGTSSIAMMALFLISCEDTGKIGGDINVTYAPGLCVYRYSGEGAHITIRVEVDQDALSDQAISGHGITLTNKSGEKLSIFLKSPESVIIDGRTQSLTVASDIVELINGFGPVVISRY